MNLWDSVHRGLEKASQEAARISKVQRLRSTIDTLSRQIQTQQNMLLNKTMELFANNQLTQAELLILCQNLHILQQQLGQAQQELKLTQSQGPVVPPTQQTGAYPNSPANETLAQTIYAPPPYQPYVEQTTPALVPPPPPGAELTISQQHTMLISDDDGQSVTALTCTTCQTEVPPGNAYCHNCGQPVKANASYLPTTRSTSLEQPVIEDMRTVRAEESSARDFTPQPQSDGGL